MPWLVEISSLRLSQIDRDILFGYIKTLIMMVNLLKKFSIFRVHTILYQCYF